MSPTALLIALQRVMPDGSAYPDPLRCMVEADLMQLVYNGGAERTRAGVRRAIRGCKPSFALSIGQGGLTWLMEVAGPSRSTASIAGQRAHRDPTILARHEGPQGVCDRGRCVS